MSEQYSTPSAQSAPAAPAAGQPVADASPPGQATSARQQPGLQERVAGITEDKPEVAAGAAFAAGLMFALILRRLAG